MLDAINSKAAKDSDNALSNISYLSTCSKVTLDAYHRVLEKLQMIKEKEANTQELMTKQMKELEDRETKVKDKQRHESLLIKAELEVQMKRKREQSLAEKQKVSQEFRSTVLNLPEEVVNVFPRITQTPPEVRRANKMRVQAEVRQELRNQIAQKASKNTLEKTYEVQEDMERLKKYQEEYERLHETEQTKTQEQLTQYKTDLEKDIQYKKARKVNEKRLEGIEYQGITALQKILVGKPEDAMQELQKIEQTKDEKCFAPVKEEGSVKEDDEEEVADIKKEQKTDQTGKEAARMEKLAGILERKQKKAQQLLDKLEGLQKGKRSESSSPNKYSVAKLREALAPVGYKMKSDGKTVRLSNAAAQELISQKQQKDNEIEAVTVKKRSNSLQKVTVEQTQKIAYQRYLKQLEAQANEEHKRIVDSLKREHDAIERIKQKEMSLKQQRLLYRQMIIDQITKKKEKKMEEQVAKCTIPEIVGNSGYPVLTPENYRENTSPCHAHKIQGSVWIKQVSHIYIPLCRCRKDRQN